MKPNLIFLISVLGILIISGCKNKAEINTGVRDQDSIPYHKKAKEIYYTAPISECIELERHAVEQLRQGSSPHSGLEVLSYMGFLLSRDGNYKEALSYLQEASDSIKTAPKDSYAPSEAVMLLGNLSNLYSRFGLHDEALEKNEESMAIARESVPSRVSDLWRMRCKLYKNQNNLDSAYACAKRALQTSYSIEDSIARKNSIAFNECVLAWIPIENPDFAPDSIPSSVKVLEHHFSGRMEATNLLLAGRGYFLSGEKSKGLELMRRGVEESRKTDDEDVEFALGILATSYAEAKDPRLFDIYQEYTELHDTIGRRLRDDIMLGKDFQYRSSELKLENALLEKEVIISKQNSIIISIVALMIVGLFAAYFVRKINRHKKEQAENLKHIDDLLNHNMQLNAKIDELNAELQSNADEERERKLINSAILDKESEMQFRKLFSSVYPGFIEKLREDFPSLSSGNELLCMLIRLRKSNDEIALALGISPESVITSRHRLRTRFDLTRGDNLNDFIQSR